MKQLYFGNLQNFQFVPKPDLPLERRFVSSLEAGTLGEGGGFVDAGGASHSEWDFTFSPREAQGADGLDVFGEFRDGQWDDVLSSVDGFNPNDLLWWSDPFNHRQNLFPAHWAAPMLSLRGGWWPIGDVVSAALTAANVYRQPRASVTFSVTHPLGTLPTSPRRRVVIPVPPGFTLRWGWSGSVTGTAVLRAEARNRSTGAIVPTSSAPLSATAATRLNGSANGDTYDCVTFGLGRTSSTASTAVVTSMLAVMHPNAVSPALTGAHKPGKGATGCVFASDVLPETYRLLNEDTGEHLKGLSFLLKEVGGWLP